MHRPVFALNFVFNLLACSEDTAGEPEDLGFGRLQIIPDDFAIGAEELVPGDFHVHGAGMDFAQFGTVRADGPYAIDLMPGAFVAKHEQIRLGWGKLNMIEPVRAGMECFNFASFDADGIETHGQMRSPAAFEACSPAAGASGWPSLSRSIGLVLGLCFGADAAARSTFNITAGEQGFVRVHRQP